MFFDIKNRSSPVLQITKSLRKIIGLDKGYLSAIYLDSISSVIQKAESDLGDTYKNSVKIAVLHHPLVPCGGKAPGCHESLELRRKSKQIFGLSVAFHGHAYAMNRHPDVSHSNRASGIPCPSLSALYNEGSHGVLINCISKSTSTLYCILWEYEPEGSFIFSEEYLTHLSIYSL